MTSEVASVLPAVPDLHFAATQFLRFAKQAREPSWFCNSKRSISFIIYIGTAKDSKSAEKDETGSKADILYGLLATGAHSTGERDG